MSKELSRRLFFPAAVVGFGGVALYLLSKGRQERAPVPEPNLVDTYYPELRDTPMTQNGEFQVGSGTRINWFNFSQGQVNEDLIRAAYYTAVDYIARPVYLGHGGASFATTARGKDSVLFIVSEDAPGPNWVPELRLYEAFTDFGFPENVSIVRVLTSADRLRNYSLTNGPTETLALEIGVEACQSMIGFQGIPQSPESLQVLQESWCNSLGLAFAFKQRGATYEEYWGAILGRPMVSPGGQGLEILMLEREWYESIPYVGLSSED